MDETKLQNDLSRLADAAERIAEALDRLAGCEGKGYLDVRVTGDVTTSS